MLLAPVSCQVTLTSGLILTKMIVIVILWLMNRQSLFISRETQRKLHSNYFVTGKPLVDHLEYPLNFECFDGSKAVDNVTHWMYKSTSAANIPKEYFSQISVNGVQCNTIYPGV